MFPEFAKNTPEQAIAYVYGMYGAGLEEVGACINEAKTHETTRLRASTWLLNEANFQAEKVGIENLPVMLDAVFRLERDLPKNERKMTPKRYLEIIITGELKTALSANSSRQFDEAGKHIDRAQWLNKIKKEYFE